MLTHEMHSLPKQWRLTHVLKQKRRRNVHDVLFSKHAPGTWVACTCPVPLQLRTRPWVRQAHLVCLQPPGCHSYCRRGWLRPAGACVAAASFACGWPVCIPRRCSQVAWWLGRRRRHRLHMCGQRAHASLNGCWRAGNTDLGQELPIPVQTSPLLLKVAPLGLWNRPAGQPTSPWTSQPSKLPDEQPKLPRD